jgi:hypothetical protein
MFEFQLPRLEIIFFEGLHRISLAYFESFERFRLNLVYVASVMYVDFTVVCSMLCLQVVRNPSVCRSANNNLSSSAVVSFMQNDYLEEVPETCICSDIGGYDRTVSV